MVSRSKPDPAAIERAKQLASEARVKEGKEPDAPEDAEFAKLQAEGKSMRKRNKR
jgi:hypothetical protein